MPNLDINETFSNHLGEHFTHALGIVYHFRLNFGLIAVTMFVSMWISNTAAVAMMIPIMQAVLEELEQVLFIYPHAYAYH